MKNTVTTAFLMALAVRGVPASAGIHINIDLGGGPAPAAAYGGAASQPGFWNALSGLSSYSLTDTAGNPTSVTFNSQLTPDGAFDHPGTTGDDEALIDDFAEWAPTGPISFFVVNLPQGVYQIYSYSFAPNAANSSVDIPTGSLEGFQLLGGQAWPGSHQPGVTYARHTVTMQDTLGDVEIQVGVWNGAWGGFNGLQIVQVPEPSSLILLALSGLALMWRRGTSGRSRS